MRQKIEKEDESEGEESEEEEEEEPDEGSESECELQKRVSGFDGQLAGTVPKSFSCFCPQLVQ